jgi:hypothetical protein
VANTTKPAVTTAIAWSLPGIAFAITVVGTGNLWVAVVVSIVGVVVARAVWHRAVATSRNDRSVVTIGHAVDGSIAAVEVFWRPGCPFLEGLGRDLAAARVPTNLRNIWESPEDAAIVRSITGGDETVPTLVIGPVALVNPSTRLVMSTLREHAPHLLDSTD